MPTVDDVAQGAESPELRTLRDAERELFPPAGPPQGTAWPTELPSPLAQSDEGAPVVHATGIPPAPLPSAPPVAEGGKDLSWMQRLELPPELPVRWEPRVVRYLEFFKDDARGHSLLALWLRRSGRYREMIRRTMRKNGVPEDLLWLCMTESAFDPAARSPVGALGLWQFMPETGRQYGLAQDRWLDARLDPQASTEAAAQFLSDLHRRFGSWELAIAAYNYGYLGVVAAVRKYNTNDFWTLSRLEGALPWETTLYVPKILAASIVARNLGTFGLDGVQPDPPVEYEEITVPPGVALSQVASAAGVPTKEIVDLNLELRAQRTPPAEPTAPANGANGAAAAATPAAAGYAVKVPAGKAQLVAQNASKLRKNEVPLDRYVVRFGESLEQVAAARGTTVNKLVELNGIAQGEVVRGGTVLLVPRASAAQLAAANAVASAANASTANAGAASVGPLGPLGIGVGAAAAAAPIDKPVVIVPADVFVYPDRKRVFYRVLTGDTLRDVAAAFKVTVDEVRRWNEIDAAGRLQEGMTLQLFVPLDADLSKVVAMSENEVRPIAVGSDDFFTYWEGSKGRKRITVAAHSGDTLESIGKRYGVTAASMERINRRGRKEKLADGDSVVVYVPSTANAKTGAPPDAADLDGTAPEPLGPLPRAPAPNALP